MNGSVEIADVTFSVWLLRNAKRPFAGEGVAPCVIEDELGYVEACV